MRAMIGDRMRFVREATNISPAREFRDEPLQKVFFAAKMRVLVRSGHTNDKLSSQDCYSHIDGSIAEDGRSFSKSLIRDHARFFENAAVSVK